MESEFDVSWGMNRRMRSSMHSVNRLGEMDPKRVILLPDEDDDDCFITTSVQYARAKERKVTSGTANTHHNPQPNYRGRETLSRRTVSSRRSKNEKGTAAVVDLTKEDIAAFRNFHEQPKLPCFDSSSSRKRRVLEDQRILSSEKRASPIPSTATDQFIPARDPDLQAAPKMKCPVCMDYVKNETSTVCGHIFCQECIKKAIRIQKKCPSCRRSLRMNQCHRIYLGN